jgi:hypothetical protein
MDISLKAVADVTMIFCFGVSFLTIKIIPTKHHILYPSKDKHVKLIKIGSIFFGLGLFILVIQLIIRLVR